MIPPPGWWRVIASGILVLTLLWFGAHGATSAAPAGAGAAAKPTPTPKPTPTMTVRQKKDYTALLAAGKKAFLTVGCSGCHMLTAAGSKATVGPSLNHIGKLRNLKWILAQIADPCAPGHDHAAGPDYTCSAMPLGLAKGKTALAIATFLAAQK